MALINAEKQVSTFSLLAIILSILMLSVFLNNYNSESSIVAINSDSNTFLRPIPEEFIKHVEQIKTEDSAFVYSVFFNDHPIERTVTIINKNPSKSEFLTQFQVHLYPTSVSKYKAHPNFKNGFLDYSTKRKPIMFNHDGDNYSFLKITLPQIDTDKIYLYQPGTYKKTFDTVPFSVVEPIALNLPNERKHLYIPVLHKLLDAFQISYLPYKEEASGQFYTISDYAQKKSNTLVQINQSERFWQSINSGDSSFKQFVKIHGSQSEEVTALLSGLSKQDIEFDSAFNIEKLANYYALINLFTDNSERKICLTYNALEKKLEPLFNNYSIIGELNSYIKSERIADEDFLKEYTKALENFGSIVIEEIIESTPKLSETIRSIQDENPYLLFESSVLKHNQLVLLKGVNPSTTIKAELLNKNDNSLKVVITNLSDYPVGIDGLNYQTKKHITDPITLSVVPPKAKDTISFNLPRSFENLFVHKKSKTTGFIFEKDIFDLNVSYNVLGTSEIRYTELIPYQPLENYSLKDDLFRSNPDIKGLDYLTINETLKTIEIVKDFELSKPLIFPKGYTIIAKPGRQINILEGGKIISYSPFKFIGTKEKRIIISSSDKEGQGLLVIASGKLSELKFLTFDGLTNPSHGMWSTTSAVTFYESPVHFDYVTISNNTCEDAINVVRTNFKMTNTLFKNTQSDAFDGDFVTGIINSCVFQDLGNDAIDVSGSYLDISNVKIKNAGDKGLSAGEDSQMKVQNVTIDNCEIAVAGKDLSIVTVNHLNIKNTKLGFTAFQKKPEFGPSNITATNIVMTDVETKYLIEDTSSLLVDGKKIETEQNVKDRMYGVEFGRSSSETRVRQRNDDR